MSVGAGRPNRRRLNYAWGALAVVGAAVCVIWIVGGTRRGSSPRGPAVGPSPTAANRPAAERAPIALQYVRLDISRSDGWTATIDIPDGGAVQIGGSPGHPLVILRPRLAAAGVMLEVARADGRPVKDQDKGAPPMVVLLEPNVPVQVQQPYPFRVRWDTSAPGER